MRGRKLSLLALLVLSACVNPYKQFYRPVAGIPPDLLAKRRVSPPPAVPTVIQSADVKATVENLLADGYLIIGISSYNGTKGGDAEALQEAKAVGADVVVTSSKYTGTVQTAVPLTVPTTQTSITNGNATAFGPAGTATAYGSAVTTTYGSRTTYIPMSVNRFEFDAVYLVKVKSILGAMFRNLNSAESQKAGTVNGVFVVIVVRGSPAADAGLLPGDIIVKADGQPVVDERQFNDWVSGHQGQQVDFTINRDGRGLQVRLALGTF